MDIISQLQEQLNEVAMLAVNTFGTLQRDAPPVRLSNSYPDPLNPNPNPDDPASQPPKPGAPGQPKDQAQAQSEPKPPAAPPAPDLAEQPKAMSHALVLAAKKVTHLLLLLGRATCSTECPRSVFSDLSGRECEGTDLTITLAPFSLAIY
jgi:mediator of RNA polymerase II transcription subunit 21